MDDLKINIRKMYGWKSITIENELDLVEERIRTDERRRFARVLYQLLLDNLHLPVSEIVNRIKRDEFGRGNSTEGKSTSLHREKA